MNTKSIFKSKTLWLNFIMGLLAIIALIDPSILSIFGLDEIHQANALKIIGAITAILNLVLRMITGQPVSVNSNKDNV